MTIARNIASLAALSALLLASARASAQDVAAAEALFNKGVADMDAGRFASACPAIAESQRLDPRPGTQFALAECNAKAGKIATAVAQYEDYQRSVASQSAAVKAKHADRLKIARSQIEKLRPAIPTLTIVLPPGAPRDARVSRDGTELSAAALGIALPVDPGEHVVKLEAGGRRPSEQRFTLDRSQKKTIELTLSGAADATPQALAAEPSSAERGKTQRIAGFVVGGVGVATLVMGGVMGGLTLAKKSTILDNCKDTQCNHEGKLAADSAKTTGLVSTIGFGVGAAALVTGIIVLVTAPKKADDKSARVSIVPMGEAGLGLKGMW